MAETRPVASMTGFARREGGDDRATWAWEVRSVNGRSLDLRCRLGSGYERMEPAVRAAIAKYCARGNVNMTLTVQSADVPLDLKVNQGLLQQVVELARELEVALGGEAGAPPRLDGLLALRGVLETVEQAEAPEETAAREAAIQADLDGVLQDLVAARRAEGAHLKAAVETHLAAIEDGVARAAACAVAQPEALSARLKAQVEELLGQAPALPEERLVQEAALLAARGDIREELDRLRAHVVAAREMLEGGEPIGRRLDFLCQEFNREANTLCSKSSDVELTRVGLELKGAIEQLREQVQNIE
jgi:uncharacterized protein (TIGR00255 family)